MQAQTMRAYDDCAGYVVSWGGGLDSTAILAQMVISRFMPNEIIFAEVGHEWPETYEAIDRVTVQLQRFGYPKPVRIARQDIIKVHRRETLGEECLRSHTLPSVSYGWHKCSIKFKPDVINAWLKRQDWVKRVWDQPHHYETTPAWVNPTDEQLEEFLEARDIEEGPLCDVGDEDLERYYAEWRAENEYDGHKRIVKCIGYDVNETRRAKDRFGDSKEQGCYEPHYPLRDWGYDRAACVEVSKYVFGFAPKKSACVFCPHAHDEEWHTLAMRHPLEFEFCLAIEALARPGIKKPDDVGLRRRGKRGERYLVDWAVSVGYELPASTQAILKATEEGRNPRRFTKEEIKEGAVQKYGIEVVREEDGRIIVVDGAEAEAVRHRRRKTR